MKNLITKLMFMLAFFMLVNNADAQIFNKGMSIGSKVFTVPVEKMDDELGISVKYDLEFTDYNGVLDVYDFTNLDTSLATEKRVAVYDPKKKEWRLPVTYNEANGIAEEGSEPLKRIVIELGKVEPAIRQKID